MMSPEVKQFFQRWLITTLAVLVAASIVPGIYYEDGLTLFLASLLLGILNTLVRPVLVILALPLVVVTLGLFMLVINGLLLYLVGFLMQNQFTVESFEAAFWGSLVISLISLGLNALVGGPTTVQFSTSRRTSQSSRSKRSQKDDDDDNGPVIDV